MPLVCHHNLGNEYDVASVLPETEREIVVLIAITNEALVESLDLEQALARHREAEVHDPAGAASLGGMNIPLFHRPVLPQVLHAGCSDQRGIFEDRRHEK